MKVAILSLCCGALICTADTAAQQFINGSFEPGGSITPCVDIPVATYNAGMGDNWAAGNTASMQIANSTCSQGNAVDGSYFGVMKYDAPYGNKIVFKLDKAMKAGTAYSFSLSYKVPVGIPPATASLRYGYSMDSTTTDSIGGYTDPLTTETWLEDTLSFTSQQAWQYVWLEISVLGGDPYTLHVDNLKMLNLPESISDVALNKSNLVLSPNPCAGSATLVADEYIVLPYTVEVYDVTGRTLLKKDNVDQRTTNIDMPGINGGVFFMKVTDRSRRVYTKKLVVQ